MKNAKVLILGAGGVGSFVLDCLYRSGITDITIVDYDRYEITNQNRQIGSEAVGEKKVDVLQKRYEGIKKIDAKIDNDWVERFDFSPFDIVIDAIDDIEAKVAIAKKVGDKLLSSMGSAKKCDPTQIRYGSIWKTYGDKFAKKFRDALKKAGYAGDFPVVFSPEPAHCKELGSFVGVTGAFGLALCAKAIEIIREKDEKQ